MPETDFVFTNTSEDAFRETVNRNVAGARLSARLWNLSNGNARNINNVVQGSVRVGQSVTAAGKAILSVSPDVAMVKIPKYVQELKNAADRARALSDSTILSDTVKKYESYINKLTRGLEPAEVRVRYAHLGIRGASRMFVKRLQSNTQEVFDSAIDKWVGRKASYQARVVARNETNEAHWLAGQKVAEDKPYVTGFKWNFGSHPRADICNEIKDLDVGMGPGIYPKGQVPARPHPNCLLPGQKVLMGNGEWKPIEVIRVGDMVIGHSGEPRKVTITHKNEFAETAIVLSFSNGKEIYTTGNHPIYVLGQGWVEAENIKEGNEIFETKIINSIFPISCNHGHFPSIFGKILQFSQILFSLFRRSVPSSAIDFDGKKAIRHSKVNIKFTLSHLWDIRKSQGIKYFAKSTFCNRLTALPLKCYGSATYAFKTIFSSFIRFTESISDLLAFRFRLAFPESFMNIGKMLPLGFGFGIPNQLLRSGRITPRKAEFSEIVSDGFSTDTKGFRKGINTFPGQVPLMDDSVINSFSNHALSYNKISVKSSKKMPYSGPVYNLTVDNDQSYFAEGILVHNCNCFLTQQFDDNYFKNYTPSAELLQQVRDDPRFPEFKSWAESWLEKTGAGFIAPTIAPAIAPEAVTPEWKPAGTIEEAQLIATKDGYELRGITNIKLANQITEIMHTEISREGFITGRIEFIKSGLTGGTYGPSGITIRGPAQSLQVLNKSLSATFEKYSLGNPELKDQINYTLYHEIGHAIPKLSKYARPEIKAAYNSLRVALENGSIKADELGGYIKLLSKKGDQLLILDEAFSECYASAKIGNINMIPSLIRGAFSVL